MDHLSQAEQEAIHDKLSTEMLQLAQVSSNKPQLKQGDFWWTDMFQDLMCWFKCLFHDCSCYNTGKDKWHGNDDSDAEFKRKRLAKEEQDK